MLDPQAGCFSGIFKRRSLKSSNKNGILSSGSKEWKSPAILDSESQQSDSVIEHQISYFNPSCDFSYDKESKWWLLSDALPSYEGSQIDASSLPLAPEMLKTVEDKLDELDSELRILSLKIHSHPELGFEENNAHDILTKFMSNHGFKVTKHYLGLSTAWRAEYTHGQGGRVLGVNSEMDALPGLGHACGHNLIAVSGVGVAIAVKAALKAHDIPGKVVLLGTPAEENGAGKAVLLERGGYKDMDACIMCHPTTGAPCSASLGSTNAMQSFDVEYFGHAAHAAAAPWEGINALDAAFLAYANISALRQQLKPDYRIHGIVQGKNWSANVIPDYAFMRWIVRAPTKTELILLTARVKNCFQAASLASGCKITIKDGPSYYDLRQNTVLGKTFTHIVEQRYGLETNSNSNAASTDFGNVTYALPALHPSFAIPTQPGGGNHTPGFEVASATKEAHAATMVITKGLAATGFRLLQDAVFCKEVKDAFDTMETDD